MFISRNAKKLLKYCIANPSPLFNTCDIDIGLPASKLRNACEELATKKCVHILCTTIVGDIQFELTYLGADYKTYQRLDTLEFLYKSILVPVIVALITSAITTSIGWMWGNRNSSQANRPSSAYVSATPSNAPTIYEIN